MEPEIKKFNWTRLILTSVYVLLAALVVGGTTWYVMEQNARDVKEANDKAVAALQKQIDELQSTNRTTKTDSTNGWKTYSGNGLEFKYPATGFNVTNGEFVRGIQFSITLRPNEQTDQPATPSILTVTGYVKAASIPLSDWITSTDAVNLNYSNGIKASKVGASDGYTFVQSGMEGGTAYAVAKGDTAYVISAVSSQSDTFNTILSTFKFN